MKNVFAERLRSLRQEKEVSQTQLATLLGVSKGIISLWENGLREPTLSNLIAISKYFDVSLDVLCGLKDF